MSERSLKSATVGAVKWLAIERYSTQIVGFLLQIFIARILVPSDYGVVGMISVFFGLASIFIDSGFSQALIRKKDRTDKDINTVFYFNISVALIFYAIMFFSAPAIARFYNEPLLIPVTRLLSIGIVTNATAAIHYTLYSISVNFKPQATISLISTIVSGLLGLFLAIKGYGVWVLVWQSFARSIISPFLMWIISKWRPRLVFSMTSFRNMFSFGSKILIAAIIDVIYDNLSNILIGKSYSRSQLGLYAKARGYAELPITSTSGLIQSALYPLMCTVDGDERLKYVYRKYLRLAAYTIFPIMFGLVAVAKPLICFMITDKWVQVVPYMQVLCFLYMWIPIQTTNLDLLRVKGRSDILLKLNVIKKAVGVLLLFLTIRFGVLALCFGMLAQTLFALVLNTYYSKDLINFGFWEQMKEYVPFLLLCSVMAVLVHLSMLPFHADWIKLVIGITVGLLYYILISIIFKIPEFFELKSIIFKKRQ